ncbi:MAG: ABC transporter ATP-binding protein [Clostridia bacterium]|nr:ABC transporter ATP-binding protein [Clostridia bacterium]
MKIKKRKEKKERGSEKKLSFFRVLSNNLFFLKLEMKAAPLVLPTMILVTVLQALAGFLSGSYLIRYALNGIGEGKSFGDIAQMLLICFAVLVVVNVGAMWYYNKYYRIQMVNVKKYIFNLAFKKAARVELARYEDPVYYDGLAKAVDECGVRADSVNNSIDMLFYRIVTFSTNFALLFLIDPLLLLFVLIPIAVIPLQTKLNKIRHEKDMKHIEERRRAEYARRTFYLSDYAKEMRLLDMPYFMLERFRQSGERCVHIIKSYGWRMATLNYILTECNEAVAALGAMLYSVWQTLGTGRMGYGDCIVVVNSIESVAYSLTNSADTLLKFHENALYTENLRNFLDYEPTLVSGNRPLPSDGDLVLKNVSFRYDGAENDTLHDVSMRFGKNEKIAIVGHNGAGKTTLIKLLLRLYDAEGSITYGGEEIKDLPLEEYRDIFAAVMQDYHVFSLTVAENVLLRKKREGDDAVVAAAIEKSGLKEKIDGFSKGVDTVMTKEFSSDGEVLSGGQQQKLAISHVYSKENRFVILDEPSSALDPIAEYEMYNRMMEACEGCGMIFISHRLSSAVMADRIYLMENGSVAESGSHAELMERNGRYAELFRRQAENYAEV